MEKGKLVLQKVTRDRYGKLELREIKYSLKDISTIRVGKLKDFHNESDISGNGMNPEDECIYIRLNYGDHTATFESDWELSFELNEEE